MIYIFTPGLVFSFYPFPRVDFWKLTSRVLRFEYQGNSREEEATWRLLFFKRENGSGFRFVFISVSPRSTKETDLHIKAIKRRKNSWGNRSIHVSNARTAFCTVMCLCEFALVALLPKVSTIPIRLDINKPSEPRYSHLTADVCVAKTYTYTHTAELIIQRGRFRVARDRQEPRKRIDLDLSRHFTVNFVSTADETRIIRKTRTASVVASLPISYIAALQSCLILQSYF